VVNEPCCFYETVRRRKRIAKKWTNWERLPKTFEMTKEPLERCKIAALFVKNARFFIGRLFIS
jgi:hypothetical protein